MTEEAKTKREDWRDLFYLNSYVSLSLVDRVIERREVVWIKRNLASQGKSYLEPRMSEIIKCGGCDPEELNDLVARAARELTIGEKRRFIYNMAQLFQSKGTLSEVEYESILDLSEKIGVPETEADAIVHSVYDINNTFFAIMGLLTTGAILYLGAVVIVPLVIAIFISMIINKVESIIVKAVSIHRFRWLTKLAAMTLILGVIFGLVMAAVVSGKDIAKRYPFYEQKIELALQDSVLAQEIIAWLDENEALEQIRNLPIASSLSKFLGSIVSLMAYFLLVVVFTGFLVFSSSSFTGILQEMNDKIGAYMVIKTLVSLVTGLLAFGLCWAFGVDFALFWGILAFLLNFIPSVGAIAATLPPILLAMIQLDSWTAIVALIILFIVINVLLGQVVEPKLMGKTLAIKPLAILLGLIFWGFLWGIPGMFLATPLMVLLRILASYFNFSRSFERLLAAEPG
ncbi:MAG: AI-2E family transporter [Deltaproteobacteria bacterium]|nr:AI-2E family transporter [Deltaproteobacteria bacterium]